MIIILGEYKTPAWIWNISLYAQNNLLLWSRQLRKVVTFGSREDRNHEVLHQGKSVLITRLGSVSVCCYGTIKSFVLKTHGSHDKITILLN